MEVGEFVVAVLGPWHGGEGGGVAVEPCAPVAARDDLCGDGDAGVCGQVVGPPGDAGHDIGVEVVELGEVAWWSAFDCGGAGAGL